jgi:hypothetical protein
MGAPEHRRKKRIRDSVIIRDGMICCYCDLVLSMEEVTMEHIVPDSKRGTYNATNLTVSCSNCNNRRGNKPFFEYCKQFNWPIKKLNKYKELYTSNLKIKILNLSKETCLNSDEAIPNELIKQACDILKIKNISFESYEKIYSFDINFSEPCNRKKIKYYFEFLIKIIEFNSC